MENKWKRAMILIILFSCFSLLNASGTYGLNKVQYHPFEWKELQTTHFDIYYYQGGDSLAAYAAREIEGIYDEASLFLKHRLRQRIPIILHNTHAQFEQTNVIRYPIPEAVGGFTEVFKNRIVLPFDGSYLSFRHVIHHELLHALVFDYVSHGNRGYNTAAKLGGVPLWMNEGLSEIGSLGWDIESESYILDAIVSGYASNPVHGMWGFMAYKGGQNFWYFLENTWGEGSVAKIFRSIAQGLNIEMAFMRATQVGLEEAGEIWLRELRRIYWPELGQRQYAKSIARELTNHRHDESYYNVGPTISPDGRHIAFFSDRGNRLAIYLLDVETESITQTVVESGHVAAHESFHPFSSSISWTADSRCLVLVSKQAGRDVIQILDAEKSKMISAIEVADLEAIWSPSVSPDGKQIVFSAQKNGIKDLYLVDLPQSIHQKKFPKKMQLQARAITHDHYAEGSPVFSPSGEWIAFHSNKMDKKDPYQMEKLDVFMLQLKTGEIRQISDNRWSSHHPCFGEYDSLMIFVSNRSGVQNLYLKETFGDSLWPISNFVANADQPTWSNDGTLVSFSLFEEGGWDVYLLKDPWQKRIQKSLPKSLFIQQAEDTTHQIKQFHKISFKNLKTWRDSLQMDSLERTIREITGEQMDDVPVVSEKPKSQAALPQENGFFIDDPAPEPKGQKESKDTLAENQELVKQDSIAPGWDSGDTLSFFQLQDSAFHQNGTLNSKPYRSRWSLDQAVALAGFSSVGGVGGEGVLTFSDLMGDQEISLWFFGAGSFEDLNLFASYSFLPKRIDISMSIFHMTNEGDEEMNMTKYLSIHDSLPRDTSASNHVWGYVPYIDRSLGAQLNLTWPLSLYSRFDFDATLTRRTRSWYLESEDEENYGLITNLEEDTLAQDEFAHTFEMGVSWSFDNAQWGVTGPIHGKRLWASIEGVIPGVLQDDMGFYKMDFDFRTYYRIFNQYAFAFRMAGGFSEAISDYENPHQYLLGGDDWTINWHLNEDHWKGTQQDVFFSSWETPLRGFAYHDFAGNRMGIMNAEFRFPFINRLTLGWPLPLTITNVTGAIFVDYGGTWHNREFMEDRGLGWGWGWRLNLGVFVLRYSIAWAVDDASTIDRGEYQYWSLGASF